MGKNTSSSAHLSMSLVRYGSHSDSVDGNVSIVYQNPTSNKLVIYNRETRNFELIHDSTEDTSEESRSSSDIPPPSSGSPSDEPFSFVCTNCGTINNRRRSSQQKRHGTDTTGSSPFRFNYQDHHSPSTLSIKSFRRLMDRGLTSGEFSLTSSGDLLSHDYFRLLASTLPAEQSVPRLLQDESTTSGEANIPTNLINQGYFDRFFKVISKLGSGSFGQVFKVEHELLGLNLGVFALKKIPIGNDRGNLVKILNEVKFLYNLSYLSDSKNGVQSHVIKYNHVWIELSKMNEFGPEIPIVFLLFEYCDGGTLEEWVENVVHPKFDLSQEKMFRRLRKHATSMIKGECTSQKKPRNLTNHEIFKIFKDIALGLKYLHDQKIIHRDLKPSNCLFKTKFTSCDPIKNSAGMSTIPTVLVSDFGESINVDDKRHRNTTRSGTTGTVEYCAPELLRLDENTGRFRDFDYSSDIYSLGMILYYLCFGTLPYNCSGPVREGIVDGSLLNEMETNLSDLLLANDFVPLITSMLDLNPDKRPSIDMVLQILQDISASIDILPTMESNPLDTLESEDESDDSKADSLNVNYQDKTKDEWCQNTGFDSLTVIIGAVTVCNMLVLNELKYTANWMYAQFLILGLSMGTSKRIHKYWLAIMQAIVLVAISTLYFCISYF